MLRYSVVVLLIWTCFLTRAKAQGILTSSGQGNCVDNEYLDFFSCMIQCYEEQYGVTGQFGKGYCSEGVHVAIERLGSVSYTVEDAQDVLQCVTGKCQSTLPSSKRGEPSQIVKDLQDYKDVSLIEEASSGNYGGNEFGLQPGSKMPTSEVFAIAPGPESQGSVPEYPDDCDEKVESGDFDYSTSDSATYNSQITTGSDSTTFSSMTTIPDSSAFNSMTTPISDSTTTYSKITAISTDSTTDDTIYSLTSASFPSDFASGTTASGTFGTPSNGPSFSTTNGVSITGESTTGNSPTGSSTGGISDDCNDYDGNEPEFIGESRSLGQNGNNIQTVAMTSSGENFIKSLLSGSDDNYLVDNADDDDDDDDDFDNGSYVGFDSSFEPDDDSVDDYYYYYDNSTYFDNISSDQNKNTEIVIAIPGDVRPDQNKIIQSNYENYNRNPGFTNSGYGAVESGQNIDSIGNAATLRQIQNKDPIQTNFAQIQRDNQFFQRQQSQGNSNGRNVNVARGQTPREFVNTFMQNQRYSNPILQQYQNNYPANNQQMFGQFANVPLQNQAVFSSSAVNVPFYNALHNSGFAPPQVVADGNNPSSVSSNTNAGPSSGLFSVFRNPLNRNGFGQGRAGNTRQSLNYPQSDIGGVNSASFLTGNSAWSQGASGNIPNPSQYSVGSNLGKEQNVPQYASKANGDGMGQYAGDSDNFAHGVSNSDNQNFFGGSGISYNSQTNSGLSPNNQGSTLSSANSKSQIYSSNSASFFNITGFRGSGNGGASDHAINSGNAQILAM